MAKRLKGHGRTVEVEAEYTEWAVEYVIDGEAFIVESDNEEDARAAQNQLGGRIVQRQVFETSWADA